MDFKEITDLIKLVSKSSLIEFRFKRGDFEITILTDKHGKSKSEDQPGQPSAISTTGQVSQAVVPVVVTPTVEQTPSAIVPTVSAEEISADVDSTEEYQEIRSPMVGTFYRSPSPDKSPYIKVGDSIEAGDVVCIVEAMKLFNEIESEISGKVVKVMVEDAAPVEYDQVLFLLEP
ncbi:MAG: acetyl-CoA carboxylase biotin carboxyl carrier protein [Saprospiraceae bacterium]|nr:acetyl-CoA carboxylase biotin carboxyl carrier protein [Saprospiraceae bacterium]